MCTILTLGSAVIYKHASKYSVRVEDCKLINESEQKMFKSNFYTEMKQGRLPDRKTTTTLKHLSETNPPVEPRWARPKT